MSDASNRAAERDTHPRTIAYGAARDQHGELWAPPCSRGTIVLLHGGFWRERYAADLMHPLCAQLADDGWIVWNVEYRRMAEGHPARWPEVLLDVSAAIDYLPRALGRTPPAPLVAVGHSAGGQLALWAAARAGLPPGAPGSAPQVPVDAAVGQAAVCDLRAAIDARLGRDAARHLLGDADTQRSELRRRLLLASPVERLPLGVPLLLVHGEADSDVPVAISRRFTTRARRAGDRVTLCTLPGIGHYEHLDPASAAWTAAERWLRDRRLAA